MLEVHHRHLLLLEGEVGEERLEVRRDDRNIVKIDFYYISH